jgi:predicted esterase
VIIPASYDKSKPTPLYIYLHGRGDTDLGLGWIGGQTRPANGEVAGGDRGPSYIQLQVFGRANNSFRYAGEDDVLQALATVRKNYNIDPDRIVLAGFSMGGAGSWQVGLHSPDLFCGLEIDAGVIGNRRSMEGLTPVQKAANSIYGITIDHAVNVLQVPLVGYAGENDAQLAASTSIREQLVREGYTIDHPSEFVWKAADIRALFLANPKQGHSHATGETLRLINEFTAENFARGRIVPDHIRFVTYTTRYNKNYWVTVDGMQQHFDRAYVDATRDAARSEYTIKTTNVSRLALSEMSAAKKITIDGEVLSFQPATNLLLSREAGHWALAAPMPANVLRKQHNLQGPINDAFLDSFICVKWDTQLGMSPVDRRNIAELDRFERMMAKEYRGAARIKNGYEITDEDIASNNLILFGNPNNNAVLRKIRDQLPIKWDGGNIIVGDKTFTGPGLVPVFIYPNPLNPSRYVVINTGLVAGGGGNGAGGYGDFAVLQTSASDSGQITTETVAEGVFDESWKVPAGK